MGEKLRPGMTADCNCEYELFDENGQPTGMRVSMQAGETLPPADREGQYYCRCGSSCNGNC